MLCVQLALGLTREEWETLAEPFATFSATMQTLSSDTQLALHVMQEVQKALTAEIGQMGLRWVCSRQRPPVCSPSAD